jgi:hypothetical protein
MESSKYGRRHKDAVDEVPSIFRAPNSHPRCHLKLQKAQQRDRVSFGEMVGRQKLRPAAFRRCFKGDRTLYGLADLALRIMAKPWLTLHWLGFLPLKLYLNPKLLCS